MDTGDCFLRQFVRKPVTAFGVRCHRIFPFRAETGCVQVLGRTDYIAISSLPHLKNRHSSPCLACVERELERSR